MLAGLAAGFFIVTLVAAWMLSRGPISLGFVEGHITEFLHSVFPSVEIEFDDTTLAWAGWDRAVDIRIINLQMITRDGQLRAEIPITALSISTRAMLNGVAAPSSLELIGPTVSLSRTTGGEFNLAAAGVGALTTGRLETFLRQLSTVSEPDDPLGYLTKLVVSDADIIVEDIERGESWVTPDAQISISRDGGRIDIDVSLLVDVVDTIADVSLVGSYDNSTERVDAGVSFSNIIPSDFSTTAPQLKFLEDIKFPIQGTVTVASSVDGRLEGVGFDVTGEFGAVSLPPPFDDKIDVESLVLRGQFDAEDNKIEIATFAADLPEGAEVRWPEPINHAFPMDSFEFSGGYSIADDALRVDRLDMDMGDVNVVISGTAGTVSSKPVVDLRIEVPALDADQLRTFWPAAVLEDVYTWVTDNVQAGKVEKLQAEVKTAVAKTGKLEVSSAIGGFHVSGVTIQYVDSMPLVTHASADVEFNKDRMDFDVQSARSGNMLINHGRVSLLDISTNVELAEIRANVSGDFVDALAIVDRDPLNYASQLGIDASTVSGTGMVDLAFNFPLRKDLTWQRVEAFASATVSAVNIPEGLFGLDIYGGELDIELDQTGMEISGEMLLETFPSILVWRQNFSTEAPFKNQYELSTHVTNITDVTDLGVDVSPFSADMIKGAVPLSVQVTEQFDGTAQLDGVGILDSVELNASAIDWRKEPGAPGKAIVSIELVDNKISTIPEFIIQTDDLIVSGNARYAEPGGRLDRIELSRVKYGRNDMSGLLVPGRNGAWDADFRGSSLDLTAVWDDVFYGDLLTSGQSFLEDVGVSVQFDRVWLSEDRGVDNLTGAVAREKELWKTIYLTANVDSGESMEVKLTPSEKSDARILTVWSLDAGAVLRTLDLYENMIGGELALTGRFDDALPNQPLKGTLDVRDYRIIKAPALAKVVSILALTGILDSLQGEGLGFDKLMVPFVYEDGILELHDARASGVSLGFTASGRVYTHADAVDIDGTIVPVYVLNSMLGNIPVVGGLFSGGDEGGGLFAANFTMTGSRSDPEVSINPLSVLTPGFLRNIFNLGDGTPAVNSSSEPSEPRDNRTDRQ